MRKEIPISKRDGGMTKMNEQKIEKVVTITGSENLVREKGDLLQVYKVVLHNDEFSKPITFKPEIQETERSVDVDGIEFTKPKKRLASKTEYKTLFKPIVELTKETLINDKVKAKLVITPFTIDGETYYTIQAGDVEKIELI